MADDIKQHTSTPFIKSKDINNQHLDESIFSKTTTSGLNEITTSESSTCVTSNDSCSIAEDTTCDNSNLNIGFITTNSSSISNNESLSVVTDHGRVSVDKMDAIAEEPSETLPENLTEERETHTEDLTKEPETHTENLETCTEGLTKEPETHTENLTEDLKTHTENLETHNEDPDTRTVLERHSKETDSIYIENSKSSHNNKPTHQKRLTRAQQSTLEVLESFGGSDLRSVLVKNETLRDRLNKDKEREGGEEGLPSLRKRTRLQMATEEAQLAFKDIPFGERKVAKGAPPPAVIEPSERRLTRSEKAKLEVLQSFGGCGLSELFPKPKKQKTNEKEEEKEEEEEREGEEEKQEETEKENIGQIISQTN